MTPSLVDALWKEALNVRKNAYAPYSGYAVGAALKLFDDERIYTGCNVENASYGATICAERTAVLQAVAARTGTPVIEHLMLVTETPAPPCGMCLQVLAEFSTPDTRITLATPEQYTPDVPISDFIPHPFSPKALS